MRHHSCSDRTGFTELLSCAGLFPSKIKSCTALQGSFAVVHFLPNCKTVSPSKQLSPNTAAFVLPAKQLIRSFFFWMTVPAYFRLESTFNSYTNQQRYHHICDVWLRCPSRLRWRRSCFLPQHPIILWVQRCCFTTPPPCTGIHPIMHAAPSIHTH